MDLKPGTPFFSIVLTTFKRDHLIAFAIESVLNQSFPDFELLVIDDGSPDQTGEVVNRYTDPRLIYIRQPNKGAGSARNNGIAHAKGVYVCFLDDDDSYLPNHLAGLFNEIQKQNTPVGFFRTFAEVHTPGQPPVKQILRPLGKQHALEYIFRDVVYLPTVCIHRTVFSEYQFNESIPLNIDYEMWIRILCKYPLYVTEVHSVIINFRGGESLSAGSEKAHENYIRTWKMIFQNPLVRKCLPRTYRNKALFNRYYWLAAEQSKKKKTLKSIRSCLHAAVFNPAFLFNRDFYSVVLKSF